MFLHFLKNYILTNYLSKLEYNVLVEKRKLVICYFVQISLHPLHPHGLIKLIHLDEYKSYFMLKF